MAFQFPPLKSVFVYVRNQAFYSANTETRLMTSFLDRQRGGGASGYHGYVKLKKTIELFCITIPVKSVLV